MNTNYFCRLYGFMENKQKIQEMYHNNFSKINIDKNIILYTKGQAHANFTDLAIINYGDCKIFGVVDKGECAI